MACRSVSSLTPFLPPHLIHALARKPPGRLPHVERFPAALLFSDIAEFTALTERLQARGRGGAEEVAAAIDSAFVPAIEAIEAHEGSIVSFGGDALFSIFPGAAAVHRALAAARRIGETFRRQGAIETSSGRVRLRIRQVVHHGDVESVHLGSARRRHHLVVGEPVRELARLEARTSIGHLHVSRAARSQASREHDRVPAPPPALRPVRAAVLQSYLPERLVPLLEGFEGCYRRVAVLFLETMAAPTALLHRFFTALGGVLDPLGGVLLKTDLSSVGTKWVCVFGIPRAHEDDPDRAGRAALETLQAAPPGLAVRGGLHAGIVANIRIGTRDRRSVDIMGDTVNTAARAMAQASWSEILVPEESRLRLRCIETASTGARTVKGKARPLELHALVSVRSAARPIRVAAPMIGRDAELRRIGEALLLASGGRGAVIGVQGDPGLGKSRLKHEAAQVARRMGFAVHEGQALAFGGAPYRAIGALLKEALDLPELPEPGQVLTRVARAADELGLTAVDRHHLADVLGERDPASPIRHLQPRDVRLNNLVAIRAACRALALRTPRLLVLEDMHWADGATVDAAAWLAQEAPQSSYLLLLLYRPAYRPPAGTDEILLGDLQGPDVARLIEAHLGAASASVTRLIKDRAGGHPFYVEEVIRHFLESGIVGRTDAGYRVLRDVRPEDLPESLESLIAARLDSLPADVRRVAQHAAVIGRSFLFEILAHLPDVTSVAGHAVEELCRRELIHELRHEPHLEYSFKHALTRDVAYSSILATHRRRQHEAVALALEQLFPEEHAEFLPMLGHHWEAAGRTQPARRCFLAAARAAASRFAHDESAPLYRRYLDLVDEPSPESIAARHDLGFDVLQHRGQLREAEQEHRRALREARRIGDRQGELLALRYLGSIRYRSGRWSEAERLYARGLDLIRGRRLLQEKAILLANYAMLKNQQGHMGQARALNRRALALARACGNEKIEWMVFGNLASMDQEQSRLALARRRYEKAAASAAACGDLQRQAIWLSNLGGLAHQQGDHAVAAAHYDDALRIVRAVGDRRVESILLGNVALLRARLGSAEEARGLYRQALELSREIGERRNEAVTLGNLGALELEAGDLGRARELLQSAVQMLEQLGHARVLGAMHRHLAELDLLEGRLAPASRHLGRAWTHLQAVGDKLEMGGVLCVRGHLALSREQPARALLREARALCRQAGVRRGSELASSIDALDRAERHRRDGGTLVRGYCPEDLTAGQLAWIQKPASHPPEGTR